MWCRVVAQWLDINSTARHYLFFGLGFLSFSDRAPARPTDRKIEGNSRERERWIVCRSGGCPQVRGWPALDFLKHHRFRAMASTVSQVLLSFREYPPSAFLLPLPLNNTLAIQMSLHNFLKRKRRERICFVLFFFSFSAISWCAKVDWSSRKKNNVSLLLDDCCKCSFMMDPYGVVALTNFKCSRYVITL